VLKVVTGSGLSVLTPVGGGVRVSLRDGGWGSVPMATLSFDPDNIAMLLLSGPAAVCWCSAELDGVLRCFLSGFLVDVSNLMVIVEMLSW